MNLLGNQSLMINLVLIALVVGIGLLVYRQNMDFQRQIRIQKVQIRRLKTQIIHGVISSDMTPVGFRLTNDPTEVGETRESDGYLEQGLAMSVTAKQMSDSQITEEPKLSLEEAEPSDEDQEEHKNKELVEQKLVSEELVDEDQEEQKLVSEELVDEDQEEHKNKELVEQKLVSEELVDEDQVEQKLVSEELVNEDQVEQKLVSEELVNEDQEEQKLVSEELVDEDQEEHKNKELVEQKSMSEELVDEDQMDREAQQEQSQESKAAQYLALSSTGQFVFPVPSEQQHDEKLDPDATRPKKPGRRGRPKKKSNSEVSSKEQTRPVLRIQFKN